MTRPRLDRDRLDFADGKVGALFRTLFFPTLVAMLFNSALTLIDGIFVGRGVGADGIAAVNIVAPLFMVATGIGLMLGIGASVVASIRLAEGKTKVACIVATQAFVAGLLLVGAVRLLCLLAPRAVVGALGCSPALEADAVRYLLGLLPGLPLLVVQCVGMMLIRLDGAPRYAMAVQIVAAAVNIALDWYMIFPLGWGVRGAAVATSIAIAAAGAMVVLYFARYAVRLRLHPIKLSATSLLLLLRNTGYMARIGAATFLTELAMSVMMLTGNYMFLSQLGEAGVAAFAIACYLFPVVFSVSNAVAQSAQPIISFNHGARQPERVARTLRIALRYATLCGACVTAALWLSADAIAGLFLSPQERACSLAVEGLPLFAACALFFAVNIAFIGYYQSIEQAALSTAYTLLRGVVLLVPSFLLLPRLIGTPGLWLAIPAAELLTCLTIHLLHLRHRTPTAQR